MCTAGVLRRDAVDRHVWSVVDVGGCRRVGGRYRGAAPHRASVAAAVRAARRLDGRAGVDVGHLSATAARTRRRLHSASFPARSVPFGVE